jgi:hypothetical protein
MTKLQRNRDDAARRAPIDTRQALAGLQTAIRVAAGGFNDSAWLAELDVQFAALYFNALYAALTGAPCAE